MKARPGTMRIETVWGQKKWEIAEEPPFDVDESDHYETIVGYRVRAYFDSLIVKDGKMVKGTIVATHFYLWSSEEKAKKFMEKIEDTVLDSKFWTPVQEHYRGPMDWEANERMLVLAEEIDRQNGI